MPDARLGVVNGAGTVTTVPTKYHDNVDAPTDVLTFATRYFLTDTDFVVVRPGIAALTASEISTLTGLIGASSNVSDIDTTYNTLGLEVVDDEGFFDHFTGTTLSTDYWTADLGATGAITVPNNTGVSAGLLATGTTDNSHATLSGDLSFNTSNSTILFEARIRLSATTNVAIEFGLTDAQSEAGGQAFTSYDVTPVAVASNACILGFLHDAGAGETNTNWSALSVKADTAAFVDTETVPVTTGYVKLAVALAYDSTNTQVDAGFFINDVLVASDTDVMAVDTQVWPWLSIACKETADKQVQVDWARAYTTA